MAPSSRIDALLEPLRVRNVELPNRIIFSPLSRGACPDGVPGPDVAAYYRRRAEGGVGTIFTEAVFINHEGTFGNFGMGPGVKPNCWPFISTDASIAGWRRVVEEVHAAGSRIFPQLIHLGLANAPHPGANYSDLTISSPSGVFGPAHRIAALSEEAAKVLNCPEKAMAEQDIQDVINAFAESAANAKAVGFDGIALHGGHGYLIDNFLWHETNVRTDKWGGDHVGRTRFAVEVIRAVRAAIGNDMPISFRFSQWKPHDLDAKLAETPKQLEEILAPLIAAGVDIFEASARDFCDTAFEGSPDNLATWTRRITGKPTVMVGGTTVVRPKGASGMVPPKTIDNIDDIMQRYARGEFDLLAVGRALLNDPNWLKKARAGEPFLEFNPMCLMFGQVSS